MTKKATIQPAPAAAPKPVKVPTHYDVLTTANGQVGAYGYSRGIILTGVPAHQVKAHTAWMTADAAAVKAARVAGATVVRFKG